MTPARIAHFMASFFDNPTGSSPVRVLDCGAGVGSLSVAAIRKLGPDSVLEAWEVDPLLRSYLSDTLEHLGTPSLIHETDFIRDSVFNLAACSGTRFTHAILNPPYKKIDSGSAHRRLLKQAGIETSNLYSAFLALTVLLMERGGQVVAIIPRSFCNGAYFRPFRVFLLRHASIDHIHVFGSRSTAFKDDDVLQENIVIKLSRGPQRAHTMVSSSIDGSFSDYSARRLVFSEIVRPHDAESFIHVPLSDCGAESHPLPNHRLEDLGLEVRTGPVVDFRLKDFWLQEPTTGSIPLLYPHHFLNGELHYPQQHKKPNALRSHPDIQKWLMSTAPYVLVKRFSSKEERRRVVAYVLDPKDVSSKFVGLENHWNVFHIRKTGLPLQTARGLACFLNSSVFDSHFRSFSGHTQVNATDLRNMLYPDLATLAQWGRRYRTQLSQDEIDAIVAT